MLSGPEKALLAALLIVLMTGMGATLERSLWWGWSRMKNTTFSSSFLQNGGPQMDHNVLGCGSEW